MIIFPDADLSKAIPAAVEGMNFAWQGQSCGSTSRLFLHESIYEQVLKEVVRLVSSLRLDDPLNWEAQMGPINNKSQYEKVKYYVEAGKKEGARLMTGGKRPEGKKFERGYWFEPTVFADVRPGMKIAREEIFGPVLSVLKWKSLDELRGVIDSVEYGLTASVWTKDLNTAIKTSQWLQSGYIWINSVGAHYPAMPFGGYKNSGIGREEDFDELLSYTQVKTIHIVL
jgi:acyl-CoA reductase-like NAD-dependent aldehyde dehydrogenase